MIQFPSSRQFPREVLFVSSPVPHLPYRGRWNGEHTERSHTVEKPPQFPISNNPERNQL
jgi:hypothetical protein